MLFIIQMACAGFGASADRSNQTIKPEPPVVQNTPPIQKNEILSKDYAVAEKALNKAIEEKDVNTLRTALKSQFLPLKQKAVEAIADLNDKTFVPDLIDALEENRGVIDGGSETQIFQEQLNKTLVSTLQRLTKLKFDVSEKPTSEEMDEIVKKVREWCKNNKPKN